MEIKKQEKLNKISSPMLLNLPMNTHDTMVWVHGVLQCAKVHCCTCTRSTHFGSTTGKSIPMCNPSCHSMLLFVLIYTCPAVHLGSPHLCSLALVCAHCHLFMLYTPALAVICTHLDSMPALFVHVWIKHS